MGTMIRKDVSAFRSAAFGMGAQPCLFAGELAYGGTALLGGDALMSQGWTERNETIANNAIVAASAPLAQAPVAPQRRHRDVPAPYLGRPPV